MSRKTIREQVKTKGIEQAMRVPKGALTAKQRRFAEQIAMGETGAAAYRAVYSPNARPKTAGNAASLMKQHSGIKLEIERIERANELAALHSAAGLRSIVISTLAEIATNPDEKAATRVQAVRAIGNLVGVDAFRETKRVEHVQNSGEIRSQILDQLKTMMLNTSDATDVDADLLLAEIAGDSIESANENRQDDNPTLSGDGLFDNGTPPRTLHSIPHEGSQHFSEGSPIPLSTPPSTPLSEQSQPPGGDIFGEKDEVAK